MYNKDAGWNLKEGELNRSEPVNFFSVLSNSWFSGNHTATYKYAFLKCILDNLFASSKDFVIPFSLLAETFSSTYWDLVSVHGLPQIKGKCSGVEQTIEDLCLEHPESRGVYFERLSDAMRKEIIQKLSGLMGRYVIGALYKDTQGRIFGFSKRKKEIWLWDQSFAFLCQNKALIDQVNYYEWLKEIEKLQTKRGTSMANVSTVLENITKRQSLDCFKKELSAIAKTQTCFYCGTHLRETSPLDHVIPWSFLKKDDLWNLVFCCRTCNSKKSDRIPDEAFLHKLEQRNKDYGILCPDARGIFEIAETARMNGVETGWKPK